MAGDARAIVAACLYPATKLSPGHVHVLTRPVRSLLAFGQRQVSAWRPCVLERSLGRYSTGPHDRHRQTAGTSPPFNLQPSRLNSPTIVAAADYRCSLTEMRSRALGQNFLRNRRTARRVAHLAGDDHSLLCVDLGAGNGSITDACLLRSGAILAIEVDPRLAEALRTRFANEPRVTILEEDLSRSVPPAEPFVIAANPPFNMSTVLVRRWFGDENFRSGALIVEKPFAGRVSGLYGATKISVSLAPFLELAIPFAVRPAEFNPQPKIDAAILTAVRRTEPALPWADRAAYWRFVNYLFERSQPTVGDALAPLKLAGIPRSVRNLPIREVQTHDVVELHRALKDAAHGAWKAINAFEVSLPVSRRMTLGEFAPPPEPGTSSVSARPDQAGRRTRSRSTSARASEPPGRSTS